MPKDEKNTQYKVQVLDRALAILEALAADGRDMALSELSEKVALHKSTTHRLLNVLERNRFVEKNADTARYRLGLKLFELGSRAVATLDIRERARPMLERLAFEAGETVHLCVLDQGEVVYLDKVEPARSVRMASSVGRRNPAHCTGVGKAMMAFMPESEVDEIVRRHGLRVFTAHTVTTPAALKMKLKEASERGFAVDWEENEQGVNCVAAPVRDYTGKVVAAISLSGPTFRVNDETLITLASAVKQAAHDISVVLGYVSVMAAAH